MKRVRCLINFKDIECDVERKRGDEWNVSDERCSTLLERNLVQVIKDVVEEKKEVAKPKRKVEKAK